MDGWCDQTKKLRQELDLNQGVNIVETEEDEGWRGIICLLLLWLSRRGLLLVTHMANTHTRNSLMLFCFLLFP